MNNNSWFKKEKPLLSLQSMGGGAAGLMISAGEPDPIEATGGTKSFPGNGYVYHVFTSSGSLVVTQGKGAEYNFLVVGAGGGGGFDRGGGGGAGGLYNGTAVKMGAPGTYPVTIGSGGAGAPSPGSPVGDRRGNNGGYSNFNGTGAGGGGGGGAEPHPTNPGVQAGAGSDGGSGGGSRLERESGGTSSNTPDTGAGPYGNPGRGAPQGEPFAHDNGGGGGGAGLLTTPANTSPNPPGDPTTPAFEKGSYGGMGKEVPWIPGTVAGVASPTNTAWFAAGGFGGGSTWAGYPGSNVLPPAVSPSPTHTTLDYRWSGAGIGGGPSPTGTNPSPAGTGSGYPGVNNTGSGGGGGSGSGPSRGGGAGGPGVVVVRYSEAPTMEASGGTIVDSGGYRTHFFTSSGTFTVTSGTKGIQYIVVGGGGSGGGKAPNGVTASGGGGAGGLISSFPEGPGGPNPPATDGHIVSPTGGPTSNGQYAVVVGGGGVGGPTSPSASLGQNGQLSSLALSPTLTVSASGGGEGGIYQGNPHNGRPGGSGGGGGYSEDAPSPKPGGPGAAGQGYPGGFGRLGASGGGGGAGEAGTPANPGPTAPVNGGDGGDGKGFADIPPSYGTPGPSPTLRYFAGGGGGGSEATRLPSNAGAGGVGGGGAGSRRDPGPTGAGDGTANTGGGGGGGDNAGYHGSIGSGGSGIVIIRYTYS
tara:strand:- start:1281 stop:3362 length:2082 start_codon:yes stop_codon:yes gene_type:complete